MKKQTYATAPALAQHTPGPWNFQLSSEAGISFVCGSAKGLAAKIPEYAHAPGLAEANARLIAAAPELLAALRELVAAEDVTIEQFTATEIDRLDAAMKQALAAIARAEGRA